MDESITERHLDIFLSNFLQTVEIANRISGVQMLMLCFVGNLIMG